MKKVLVVLLSVIILIPLIACSKNKPMDSTFETDKSSQNTSYSQEIYFDISSTVDSKSEISSKQSEPFTPDELPSTHSTPVSSIVETPTESNPVIPTVKEPQANENGEINYLTKVDYGYTYDNSKSQKHTWLPLEKKYCYSLLNSHEKEIYLKIDKAVRNLKVEIEFDKNTSFEEFSKVLEYYEYDNPECFYLQYRGGAFYEISGEFSAKFFYNFGENKTFPTDFEGLSEQQLNKLKNRISEFNAAVENFISTIPADAPDVVKEIMIYDKLIIDSKYNLSAAEDADKAHQDNFTPFGVLINKTGVCESYSEAFQLLCNAVGINCTLKHGDNHQWNAVLLDGEWYECDVTFDDPINGKDNEIYGHNYFNRTTSFMSSNHHETFIYNVPVCSATKYDFLNYFLKQ